MYDPGGKEDVREEARRSTQPVQVLIGSDKSGDGIRGVHTDFEGRDV
jgi:hypothetical protein